MSAQHILTLEQPLSLRNAQPDTPSSTSKRITVLSRSAVVCRRFLLKGNRGVRSTASGSGLDGDKRAYQGGRSRRAAPTGWHRTRRWAYEPQVRPVGSLQRPEVPPPSLTVTHRAGVMHDGPSTVSHAAPSMASSLQVPVWLPLATPVVV